MMTPDRQMPEMSVNHWGRGTETPKTLECVAYFHHRASVMKVNVLITLPNTAMGWI